MTEQKIKEYIKKEVLFHELQIQKGKVEIALEILLTTGLVEIEEIIRIKETTIQKVLEIIEKEKLNV